MAKCQVVECTDPECEGVPWPEAIEGGWDEFSRIRHEERRKGWLEGHRSAAKHAQVLKLALELAEDIWDSELGWEYDELRYYEKLREVKPYTFEFMARQELAEEENDA